MMRESWTSQQIARNHIELLTQRLRQIDAEIAYLSKDRVQAQMALNDLITKHFPEEGEAINQLVKDILEMEF